MSVIYIESAKDDIEVQRLIQLAISAEVNRFNLALENARQRLGPFEKKYNVTSAEFIKGMAAEDLEGGDDEYVRWAGEYQLMLSLQRKLDQLQGVEYGDYNLLYSD